MNDSAPALNSTNLNHSEAGIQTAQATADAAVPKSLVTTAGDLIYATASAVLARLGIGSSGTALQSNGTAPVWTSSLDATARHTVKKAGTTIGTRRAINFTEGGNIILTIADDPGNEEVDITVAATGGGSAGHTQYVYNVNTDYGAAVYSSIALAAAGADATTAVQTAINAANTAGGGLVIIPAGFVRIATGLTMKANVTLAGTGKGVSGLVFDDVAGDAIAAAGTNSNVKTLAATATFGNNVRSVQVATVSGFAAGDWVALNFAGAFRTFISRVAAVTTATPNDTIWLEEELPCTFDSTSTIRKVAAAENMTIRDLTISSPTQNCFNQVLRQSNAINFLYTRRVAIENVDLRGWSSFTSGISLGCDYSHDVRIENCDLRDCSDSDPNPSQNSRTMEIRNSTHVLIRGNSFHRCGASAAMSFTGTAYATVANNIIGGQHNWVGGGAAYGGVTTTTTGTQNLNAGTFNVVSTTGFPASGVFFVKGVGVTYTGGGGGGTSFTGCTGGTAISIPAGTLVGQTVNSDGGGRGIKMEIGNFFFSVVGNTVHDAAFNGIKASAGRFGVIANNIVHSAHDPGIIVVSDGAATDGRLTDVTITGNVVRSGLASTDVLISVSAGNTVSTTSTGSQAMNVATFNVASTTGFPTAGTFYVSGYPIAYTGGGGGGTSFTGCTGGIATTIPASTPIIHGDHICQYVTVSDNILSDCPAQGILVDYNAVDCMVANNTIHDCATPIRLRGSRGQVISNKVRGTTGSNAIDSSSGGGSNQIWGNRFDKTFTVTATGLPDFTDMTGTAATIPGQNYIN